VQAAVTTDHLVFVGVFYGSDNERRKNAILLNALDEGVHLRIVPDLIGVVFKGAQFGNCKIGLFHLVAFLSFLRVRLLCFISICRSASSSACICGMCLSSPLFILFDKK